jgi:hypothetical protein
MSQAHMEKTTMFDHLTTHLDQLAADPESVPQDEVLYRTATYVLGDRLGDAVPIDEKIAFVTRLYHLLSVIHPQPAFLKLLAQFLKNVPLYRVMDIEPPIDFKVGLDPSYPTFNSLILTLLENIDASTAERLATNHRETFEALVRLWLLSTDVGISLRTSQVLRNVLRYGRGPAVKRVFYDKDVYSLIFQICAAESNTITSDRNVKSIAQARLLDFTRALAAWDWRVTVESHYPEVESQYGLKKGEGLLDFATRYAPDSSDILLRRNVLLTYTTLLAVFRGKPWAGDMSPALEFLTTRNLHDATLKIFHSPEDSSMDPADVALLYTEAATYTGVFASSHPKLLLSDSALCKRIIDRLQTVLTYASWGSPTPDLVCELRVISMLPRSLLMRQDPDLVSMIPFRKPVAAALSALERIFHGPDEADQALEPTLERGVNSQRVDLDEERKLAQALFQRYYGRNTDFFVVIVKIAGTTALPETALAAMSLLKSIMTAKWEDPLDGVRLLMSDAERGTIVQYLNEFPDAPTGAASHHAAPVSVEAIARGHRNLALTLAHLLKKWGRFAEVEQMLLKRYEMGISPGSQNSIATATR